MKTEPSKTWPSKSGAIKPGVKATAPKSGADTDQMRLIAIPRLAAGVGG